MNRLAIWLFAFSPMMLLLIPVARERWGVGLYFITCITLAVGIVLELIVMKRRSAAGVPSTSLGNWLAKAFGMFLAVAVVIVVGVGILGCAAI
jgi:hypothetical protein